MLSVSTKTGDKGESSLANGQRLSKTEHVFEVIGTLDELNSWLGLLVAKIGQEFSKQRDTLLTIQDTLFYLSAEVAQAPKVTLTQTQLEYLEKESEELQKSMQGDWHSQFLLPGGTELGGYADIARTVCRRAERELHRFSQDHPVSDLNKQYLNRLSDYLYVLRCHLNQHLSHEERKFIRK